MAGTINIIPSAVGASSHNAVFIAGNPTSHGWNAAYGTTSSNADLYAAFISNNLGWIAEAPASGDQISFIFDQGTPIFSLDSGPLISFIDLPSGLLIDAMSVVTNLGLGTGIPGYTITGGVTIGGALTTEVLTNTFFYNYIIDGSISPLIALGKNIIGTIAITGPGTGFFSASSFGLGGIGGTYLIFAFSWGIKNGTTPKRIVRSNLQPLKVTVESPGDPDTGGPTGVETGGLDGIVIDDGTGISSIVISYYTPSGILKQRAIATEDIIVQEDIIFIFIINIILLQFFLDDLDIAINNTTFYLSATGNGIQFSGTVPLGTLNILLVDASGMYKVVSGKRNDTLYDGHDGDTFDSAIPNPFIKGGFIGG